jgi:hypothetical protein
MPTRQTSGHRLSSSPDGTRRPGRGFPAKVLALALFGLALAAPNALAVGPPIVNSTTFSAVTESSATFEAKVNPNSAKTDVYHFQYVPQAAFEESGFANAKSTADGPQLPAVNEDIGFTATVEGLTPGTAYLFRVFAHNAKGDAEGPPVAFATFAAAPVFGSCPNEDFRSGKSSPPTHPSALLPDCRAYEQASPAEKNGGDATGVPALIKASPAGDEISFTTTSPIPGGDGAQGMPTYLAVRGAGSWSNHGLLAPATAGFSSLVRGWTPDFSQVFNAVIKPGTSVTTGFFSRPGAGGLLAQIAPYAVLSQAGKLDISAYAFAGASADGSKALFEATTELDTTPAGRPNARNVYAWDSESQTLRLASVFNDGQPPAKGAFAGPYDWVKNGGDGGANGFYYLQDQHAVSADGSVYFTAIGSNQLYLRRNPTEPQSAMSGEVCTEADKACTFHVSAPQRNAPDTGGPQAAAFMAASAGGSNAYFTSSEMLTNDANTGPEQPIAGIGRADIGGTPVDESFLTAHHALGMAAGGGYLYWADPAKGTIGRAKLNGLGAATEPDDEFIVPGPTEAETHLYTKPGVFESGPSRPRYVAVDSEYVYWTNSGPLGENRAGQQEQSVDKAGTIGRAKLLPGGGVDEIKPEFIKGASNPQGIAVNASHIYWANAGENADTDQIARAEIDGNGVEQKFHQIFGNDHPQGLALSPTHVYWVVEAAGGIGFHVIYGAPLEGGEEDASLGIANHSRVRGIAVDGTYVYWATSTPGGEAIGRVPLFTDFKPGGCAALVSCEPEFIKLSSSPFGLAEDGEHLYWSSNGEAQPNPGNDLYRYDAKSGALSDLTPDPSGNGAEVKGVLGTSADGSYVYFAANGDLDGEEGPATVGDCRGRSLSSTSGECNLYLWHEGSVGFIARLEAGGDFNRTDALDWTGTPQVGGGGDYSPKPSFVSPDGQTLLFRSQAKLSAYDNKGVPELYRYRVGEPQIVCVSCNPTGAAPTSGPTLGTIQPPAAQPLEPAETSSRILSGDGERAFFETTEALVAADTNGAEGCPLVGSGSQGFHACQDVYEWEAPGVGSCEEGGPGYAPLDGGCLYLISTGKGDEPAFLGDASASGDDVFFFTRSHLVGQDEDELLDVYDARVGGGLAAQNEAPKEKCEGEGCKPSVTPAPSTQSAGSEGFQGPGNAKAPNPRCPKGKRQVRTKQGKKSRCVSKHKSQGHAKKRHAGANRGGSK